MAPDDHDTTWRVTIDNRICVGSGSCIALAPNHFAFDEDDRSRPSRQLTDPDDALLTAAEMCPTGALTILDAETGREV